MASARRALRRVSLQDATEAARDYFQRAHGTYGFIGFVVEGAEELASAFVIRCEFWTGLGAATKTPYEVTVDKANGEVTAVRKVER
jgi:hypothetical protein